MKQLKIANSLITFVIVLIIVLLNYGISVFLPILVSEYFFYWKFIASHLLFTAVIIDLIIVLFQWFYFRAKFKGVVTNTKDIKIGYLVVLVIIITLLFHLFYSNKSMFFDVNYLMNNWSFSLSTVIIIPIIEELIFRGILVQILYKNSNLGKIEIIYISFLFMLIHVDLTFNWIYLISVFITGILLLLIRMRKGIGASIIIHSLLNFILVFLN